MILRVGTFNLFQFCSPPYSWYIKKDKFTDTQWQEKLSWIRNQIIQMNCDIIGFQEVFSSEELKVLLKELGFEYFLCVDKPRTSKENKFVYTSTTVALASKYSITDVQEVETHGFSLKKLKFQGHFKFSRKPIKAKIQIEENFEILFYVNHFKSNRLNEFEYIFKKENTLKEKIEKTKIAIEENYSLSLKQRLAETASLYNDIKKEKLPVICVCDLNDKEYSLSIEALTNKAYHDKKAKNSYILYDSFYLCEKKVYNPHPEQKEIKRTPTSYYQSYGNVLDYIFVSKHFNQKENNSIGLINSYEVFDEHLINNHDGSITQSDHASVVCEISIS